MGKDANTPKPVGGSPPPRRGAPQTMLLVINGVLAGVGSLYLTTGSVIVTIIGAAVAIASATLYSISGR